MYKILEADYDRQSHEADNQRADFEHQRLTLTDTITSQQQMLEGQQFTINAMERQISTLATQNRDQATTIASQQATIADQQSRINDLERRQKRYKQLVHDSQNQLNTGDASQNSAQLEVAELKKEVTRVTEQTNRFMGLMERGEKLASARVEQARGECEAQLELKDDRISEQTKLIASLQAQVSRLERKNHKLKSGSEREKTSVGGAGEETEALLEAGSGARRGVMGKENGAVGGREQLARGEGVGGGVSVGGLSGGGEEEKNLAAERSIEEESIFRPFSIGIRPTPTVPRIVVEPRWGEGAYNFPPPARNNSAGTKRKAKDPAARVYFKSPRTRE